MVNIAVLVLAAGKSSRINGIKQLERINGKTLLDITLETAQKVVQNNIFCVLGANAKKIQDEISTKNIKFIENKNFEKGLSSSIVSGINHFKNENLTLDGVLILLADQPAIDSNYLKTMIHLFKKEKQKIIASSYRNKKGVPAIFPRKYFSDLLMIKGDKGAKQFLKTHQNDIITPKVKTNLIDIDTKEDLDFFKNQFK